MNSHIWDRANRELLAKLVTELTFEEVLQPASDGDNNRFRLVVDEGASLTYTARNRSLGHCRVDPSSLHWERDGEVCPLPDVADFVALACPALGVDPSVTAGAIAELSNTVYSDALQLAHGRPSVELVKQLQSDDPAGSLWVEAEMRGHPWIVANKGRLGFDADDLARYAPESSEPIGLIWLAASPDVADARCVAGLDHHEVVRDQVGDEVWQALRAQAPDDAVFIPVHPWQWRERIETRYTAQLARRELVVLDDTPARYLPQQSIRTLVDMDRPDRRYLKVPVSILNTSVYRGLPRERTLAAPALTEWLGEVAAHDPFLSETGLVLLGEVASVSVAHPAYEAVPEVPYQYTEMLGAIWRESVASKLARDERAVTLAAVLHRDPSGVPFLAPLLEHSGLTVGEWVDELHRVTLEPLIHMLYRYGVTFSPHGQNCLLALRDGTPTRLVVKDFVDDLMVSSEPLPELESLPANVRHVLGDGLEPALQVQWIQGGLLLCVHRYLSELLEDEFGYSEKAFWASARRTLHGYQDRFAAELADRFELFDLDAPAFVKLCLNRVRLFERGYADDPERPSAAAVGWVDNPLQR